MKDTHSRKLCFFFPLIGAAFLFLFSLFVMLLWNGVLAAVIPVSAVSFWQAMGILLLAKILFGGFGPRRGPPFGRWRRRMMMDRAAWEKLTPEERENLRQEMRQRFGAWPQPPFCGE